MARLNDTRIDGNLQVTDSLNISGTSFYKGDTGLQIGSSICVDGDISDCLSINTGTLTTTGTAQLGNKLTVTSGGFDITGDGTCHNGLTVDGGVSVALEKITLSASGDVTANSFNARSDARLKENISSHNFENSILDLDVKKFDFINGPKNQIGCLAQDLIKICPEIVNEGDDGYLKINEIKIIYLLLQEMKMLRNEVDSLKTQLEYKNIDL